MSVPSTSAEAGGAEAPVVSGAAAPSASQPGATDEAAVAILAEHLARKVRFARTAAQCVGVRTGRALLIYGTDSAAERSLIPWPSAFSPDAGE